MKKVSVLFILITIALAACAPATPSEIGENDIQTAVAKTKEAEGFIQTMVAQTVAAITPSITPTATETPTPTATHTPEPPPSVAFIQNANCRSGPGSVYPLIVIVMQGETLIIDGQNEDQSWWRVLPPDKDPCLVPVEAVEVSGKTESVVVLQAPPTPTPGPVGTSLVIRYGQTLGGEFTALGQKHNWAFEGKAGDIITIVLSSNTTNISTWLQYPSIGTSLVNGGSTRPYGSGTDVDPYVTSTGISNYVLPNTGYYYLAVKSFEYKGGWYLGRYTLTLTKR